MDVRSVAVEDLAVVLDLEEEMLDDALRQIDHAVCEESQRDEVAVPLQEKVNNRESQFEIQFGRSITNYVVELVESREVTVST